jgi:hypothetical protein
MTCQGCLNGPARLLREFLIQIKPARRNAAAVMPSVDPVVY